MILQTKNKIVVSLWRMKSKNLSSFNSFCYNIQGKDLLPKIKMI
jgi:hypothetical protein